MSADNMTHETTFTPLLRHSNSKINWVGLVFIQFHRKRPKMHFNRKIMGRLTFST